MENVKMVRKWFQQGTMCVGLDLTDSFLHFPMSAQFKISIGLNGRVNYTNGRSYLLVSWNMEKGILKIESCTHGTHVGTIS